MRRFRRTTLIAVGCLACLVGIGLSRKVNFAPPLWILILITFCLLLLKPKSRVSLFAVIFLGLSFGLWRGGIYMQHLQALQKLSGQKVTIEASALSDAVYGNKSQIEFIAGNTRVISPTAENLKGKIKVSGFGAPMVYRGDRVLVTGKMYPMRGSNQARIAYAQLSRVGSDSGWIHTFTRRFAAGAQSALPEPQASFGMGLLIGQRTTLPQDILTQLTVVGLVHIVAVSGYNLTIIVRAISRLKITSKFQHLIFSLALITAFVLMTGFSASIVRAAIVSVLSLWAWYYGLKFRAVVLILLAAAITGLFNPFYVWSDLGWYLSFLAFFGVLVIAPILATRFFKRKPKMLSMVLLETLSAELMTLPLIMLTFGQFSVVAILANLLVVPLVPYAMLLTAAAAAAGMWVPFIAGWIAWPAKTLLTYMLDLVHLLSNLPMAMLHLNISPAVMVSLYGCLLFAVFTMRRKVKNNKLEKMA